MPAPGEVIKLLADDGCDHKAKPLSQHELAEGRTSVCEVRTEHGTVRDLEIPLKNGQIIRLWATNAPLTISLTEGAPSAMTVRVEAPLAFKARARVPNFAPSRPLDLADGIVRAAAGATFAPSRVQGANITGTLQVGWSKVGNVSISCADLTTASLQPAAPTQVPAKGKLVAVTRGRLPLAKAPGTPILVEAEGLEVLEEKGREGGAIRVAAEFTDGSRIDGFAPADALEPVEPEKVLAEGGEGLALCGDGGCPGMGTRPYEKMTVEILPNTQVYSEPGGEVWATVPAALRAEVIRFEQEQWLLLSQIPGIQAVPGCPVLRLGYVPLDRVKVIEGP